MEYKKYSENELKQLHIVLYDILKEIDRVCRAHNIRYFAIGGTAIGVHFWESIIPWDDDIDICMTSEDYKRFMQIAPKALKKGYTLQWPGNEKHTPFYFAKVRKDNTLFIEEVTQNLNIHQGIYVDIFPMNKVPQKQWKEKVQRFIVKYINIAFICKDVWILKYCGKTQTSHPYNWNFLFCLIFRIILTFISKDWLYRAYWNLITMYDNNKSKYYNIILMPRDHIPVESILNLQTKTFGPLTVPAPNNLIDYLRNHYENLTKDIPEDKKQNHRPIVLSFDTTKDSTNYS